MLYVNITEMTKQKLIVNTKKIMRYINSTKEIHQTSRNVNKKYRRITQMVRKQFSKMSITTIPNHKWTKFSNQKHGEWIKKNPSLIYMLPTRHSDQTKNTNRLKIK